MISCDWNWMNAWFVVEKKEAIYPLAVLYDVLCVFVV